MAEKKKTLFTKMLDKTKQSAEASFINTSNSMKIKIVLIGASMLLCTLFFTIDVNRNDQNDHFIKARPGDKWSEQTVVAEFSFPVYKDKHRYAKEVKEAKENTPLVFTRNKNASATVFAKIDTFANKIIFLGKDAPRWLKDNYNYNTISFLLDLKPEERATAIRNMTRKIKHFLQNIYRNNVIDTTLQFIKNRIISVYIPPNNEILLKKEVLIDKKKFVRLVKQKLLPSLPESERQLAYELVIQNFTANLEYSDVFTKEAIDLAVKNVAKRDGYVREGEVIISKGEIVSESTSRKIDSYNMFRYHSYTGNLTFWMIVGNFGHTFIIFSILILYLTVMRKRIFGDNIQMGVLCSVMVLIAFLSWLTMQIRTPLPIEYFIFLPGLSMLVAIVFDSRTAFYTTVTMTLMLAGVRGNDYDTGITMMIAGILAGYSVRDIQSRTQLFRSMFFIFIGFS